MLDTSLEKLESLIPALLDEAQRLRNENTRLAEEIAHLRQDLSFHAETSDYLNREHGRLSRLEADFQKYQSERTLIRTKVRGLLKNLDRIDFV
ncbi:MAG: hypothetical protein ACE5ER_12825 [Nitrospinaceae bacterium]